MRPLLASRAGRALARSAGVFLMIYLTGRLGIDLAACGLFLVPCWVASGVALIALILWGPVMAPAVWLGFIGLELRVHPPPALAVGLATAKTLAALIGLLWLRRAGFQSGFRRTRDILNYTFIGAFGSMFLSAGLSTLVLLGAGQMEPGTFFYGWWERWWMDALGVLLIGPPLLLMGRYWEDRDSGVRLNRSVGSRRELALAWAAMAVISVIVISPVSSLEARLPEVLLLPFLVWIAMRGTTLMASWAALGVCGVGIWREILQGGLPGSRDWEVHRVNTWAFLASATLIALLVSVLRQKTTEAQAALADMEIRQRVEDWSRRALDHLPLPVLITRDDGTVAFINQEYTRRFGYLLEDIPTLAVLRRKVFLDASERIEWVARRDQSFLDALSADGSTAAEIVRVSAKDGSLREVEVRMRAYEGQTIYSVADQTERIEQLREIGRLNRFLATLSQVNQCLVRTVSREELFHDICELAVIHAGFALAWIGWADPRSTRVEPLASAGEAVGYLEGIEVHWREDPEGRGPVGTCFRNARTVVCNDIGRDPLMAPWRDRAQAWDLKALLAVPIREGGEVRGALAVYSREAGEFQTREVALLEEMVLDISFALDTLALQGERQRVQEALMESEARLRMTLEATGIGLWDWDMKRDVWFSTPTYFQMLGYDPSEAEQNRELWGERTHPEDRERVVAKMVQVRDGGEKGFNIEFRFRHADGSYRWVNSLGHAIAFDEAGRAIRMLGLQIDITPRVTLEGQLQQALKLEAIGQLAGGVAHDFNNILGAITGFTELAGLKRGADDPGRHDLDQVLKAARRGAVLTQSLLAFSRKQPVRMERLDLSHVVKSFEGFIRRLLPEDITLTLRLTSAPTAIEADRTQVEQVLMNLVVNARDAMQGGGDLLIETLRVETHPPSARGSAVAPYSVLSVSDSGTGIPEEIRNKIFDPFFTTKELGKGTGLGLSTVYGIIQRHEGFIDLHSEPGNGTTFRIHLPMADASLPPAEEKVGPGRLAIGGTETLLLAEDDAAMRAVTATILSRHGYTVIEAVDGQEAVERFAEMGGRIQLVVLDGIMPRLNGWEAWKAIHALNPGIKALFISGYAEEIFTHDGVSRDPVESLTKPFTAAVLLAKVREVLDREEA